MVSDAREASGEVPKRNEAKDFAVQPLRFAISIIENA